MYPDFSASESVTSKGACVVVLSNCGNADVEGIASGLGSILFGDIPQPYYPEERTHQSLPPSILQNYCGRYALSAPYEGQIFILRISKATPEGADAEVNTLDMLRADGTTLRATLKPRDESVFWLDDLPEKMAITFDVDGKVIGWTEPWTTAVKLG